ncbi:MAG: LptF/LptG family permease, partial [Candidatus Cloacimonetes bacterium]|nr:LptF/LptG family permease [Candidatus Cloacimonadota bacterium]
MKILERYFLKETFKHFTLSVIVITFVMMLDRLIDLLNIIIEKQLDVLTIISLFSLSMPFILALSVPIAVLNTSIMTFGRMAVDQELTAIKACGVNIYKVMIYMYIAAFLLAGGMAYFNDFILPETNHTLKNLMLKVTYRKPVNAIKPGIFTTFENISIYANDVIYDELHGIIIYNRESSSFLT